MAALAIIAGSAISVWLINDYARTRVEAQTSLAHIGEEAGEQEDSARRSGPRPAL